MPLPTYNAPLLTRLFLLSRLLLVLSLSTLLSLPAALISSLTSLSLPIPHPILLALSLSAIALLYTLLSIALFLSTAHLSLLLIAGTDLLLSLALGAVAVLLSPRLAPVGCLALPRHGVPATNAEWVAQVLAFKGEAVEPDRGTCIAAKSGWGVVMLAGVVFLVCAGVLPVLFVKKGRVAKG